MEENERRKFTWFPKFTDVLKSLPPDMVGEMAIAIADYGTIGKEPEFSNQLMLAVFAGIREDIDNSINARHRNKGGRPKRKTPVTETETMVNESETPVTNSFEDSKPPLSVEETNDNPRFDVLKPTETPVTEVSETDNPSYDNSKHPVTPLGIYKPNHTNPNHTNPNHTNPNHTNPNHTNPNQSTPNQSTPTPARNDHEAPKTVEELDREQAEREAFIEQWRLV